MINEKTYKVVFKEIEVTASNEQEALECAVADIRELYHSGLGKTIVEIIEEKE